MSDPRGTPSNQPERRVYEHPRSSRTRLLWYRQTNHAAYPHRLVSRLKHGDSLHGFCIRHKRRRSAQANDAQLLESGSDPYRSSYSAGTPGGYTGVVVLAIATILFAIVAILATYHPGR